MDFVVIDVETANPDLASICQVGVASFRDGALVETWASLVNPEDYFSPLNVSIHHIGESHVEGAPTWSEVFPEVASRLQKRITVSHSTGAPWQARAAVTGSRNANAIGSILRESSGSRGLSSPSPGTGYRM